MIFKHGLAFIKDGKLLLVKKKSINQLLTPGGKPEGTESYEECLAREIKEELDSEIDQDSITYFGTFEDVIADNGNDTVKIEMYIGKIDGSPKPSREIEKIFWVNSKTESSMLSPIIRRKILPALITKGYLK